MTPTTSPAVDTVRAFLGVLGTGDRARLGDLLAEDAEYRGSGSQRPVAGDRGIARLLGLLYAGTGTTVEAVEVESRGDFVVSERRDRLRTGEILTVRAMATVQDGRITSWTDIDPRSPVRLGRLVGRLGSRDTRGHACQPTSTPS